MKKTEALFEKIYNNAPEVCCFAPGRVNLIGEHTDYNGGHVFPCAINLGIRCAVSRRSDSVLRFFSANFQDSGIIKYSKDDLSAKGCWADYPVGVIRAFGAFGYPIESGADFCFSGDLPDGSGLSSSAALEVATGTALKELFSIPVTPQEIALIGQFAENRFIGVNCGIMDQFASAMGKRGCAVLLNTETLGYKYAPALKVSALCAVTPEEFEEKKHLIADPVCRKRARHAVYENRRALDGADALISGDLELFGQLMNASHESLRRDYEVSCAELDFLSETARSISGVYGSRMTGGGFGGCTVSLLKPDAVANYVEVISAAYKEKFGIIPEIYNITAEDGAEIIKRR